MEKPNSIDDNGLTQIHQIGTGSYLLVYGKGSGRRFEVSSTYGGLAVKFGPGEIWDIPLMGIWVENL